MNNKTAAVAATAAMVRRPLRWPAAQQPVAQRPATSTPPTAPAPTTSSRFAATWRSACLGHCGEAAVRIVPMEEAFSVPRGQPGTAAGGVAYPARVPAGLGAAA